MTNINADDSVLLHNLLYVSLNKYYSKNNNMVQLLRILNNDDKISLRIIDWFVTNYSKKNNIVYSIPKKQLTCKKPFNISIPTSISIVNNDNDNNVKVSNVVRTEQFIVYLRYKAQLKAFSKKKFDPFCRNNRIINWGANKNITTTIGQLNFFQWAIKNKIMEYITEHLHDIETDMNMNIRKHYKKKTKKSKKKLCSNNINNDINTNNSNKNSKKNSRRELSVSATKTLHRVKLPTSIILDFD